MGHPKKQRKKYSKPLHPWRSARIEEEKILVKDYGLKTKKEIWKAESLLRKFKSHAKSLIARKDEQSKKEEIQLLEKLSKLNLVSKNAKLDDVLTLGTKDILERRLQTILYKRKLARSINQARQFILHGHVMIGERKTDVPSYYVSHEEEAKIGFSANSSLFSEDHPERVIEKKEIKTQVEDIKTKKEDAKE